MSKQRITQDAAVEAATHLIQRFGCLLATNAEVRDAWGLCYETVKAAVEAAFCTYEREVQLNPSVN